MIILKIYKNVLILSRDYLRKFFYKRNNTRNAILYLLSVLFFTNCATIIKGPTEQVTFTSEPTGAKVIIEDSLRGETPLKLNLRSADDYSINLELDTNKSYQTSLKSSFATRYLIGDLVGTPYSFAVDWISKSWWELDKENIHVVFTDTTAYEKDTVIIFNKYLNNFRKRFVIDGFYGFPIAIGGTELNINGTYMFSENWGVSAGYSKQYDMKISTLIGRMESIYLQAYLQRELFRNIYFYGGLGISYATITSKFADYFLFFLPSTDKSSTYKIFIPNFKIGFKYKLFNHVLIAVGISTKIGLGVSYVF